MWPRYCSFRVWIGDMRKNSKEIIIRCGSVMQKPPWSVSCSKPLASLASILFMTDDGVFRKATGMSGMCSCFWDPASWFEWSGILHPVFLAHKVYYGFVLSFSQIHSPVFRIGVHRISKLTSAPLWGRSAQFLFRLLRTVGRVRHCLSFSFLKNLWQFSFGLPQQQ